MLFWFDWSEFITFAIGDMKRTKSSGPRTEPWGTLQCSRNAWKILTLNSMWTISLCTMRENARCGIREQFLMRGIFIMWNFYYVEFLLCGIGPADGVLTCNTGLPCESRENAPEIHVWLMWQEGMNHCIVWSRYEIIVNYDPSIYRWSSVQMLKN